VSIPGFCAIYVYAPELYPTEVRTIGIGFAGAVGRIGGIIAPFLIMLQDNEKLSFLPYLIFGILAIIAGISILLLPETTGKPILQSIQEVEKFYSKGVENINYENFVN